MADLTAVAAEAMGASATVRRGHRRYAGSDVDGRHRTRTAVGTAAYGIALLSRYPARRGRWCACPAIPTRFPMYLPGPNRVMVVHEEPRAADDRPVRHPAGRADRRQHPPVVRAGLEPDQLRRPSAICVGSPGRSADGRPDMDTMSLSRGPGCGRGEALTLRSTTPDEQLDDVLTDDYTRGSRPAVPCSPILDHWRASCLIDISVLYAVGFLGRRSSWRSRPSCHGAAGRAAESWRGVAKTRRRRGRPHSW